MLTDNSFVFQTTEGTVTITAKNPANLNSFWGSVLSQMARAGIVGEHSSSHGVFTPNPGDGGRDGVGNSSKDNPRFQFPDGVDVPGEGTAGLNGLHALFQGIRLGDPNLPPGAIEGTIGPFVPSGHPNITVTFDFIL